jgi:hypothetical protein
VVVLWLGLLLLSFVSKQNMRSYYGWVYCCCRSSVNKIYGRIMVALVVVVINQKAQYAVLIWLGLSSLSSVNKHNLLSHYD